ncbi:hypothetical protein HTZ77_39980 [Nonomuraea sp. SMC257]|uniref:Uncharacterized protein n=1 Tax=Nonomuraea montanisoli TaxID=2741721 RepID=A0A7Y6IH30_9ACTN|nr:DUF6297 family protein [Nonomuraea montanisoli]NUW37538.1 hypothetical protein [Nonomuraea montanisoli]
MTPSPSPSPATVRQFLRQRRGSAGAVDRYVSGFGLALVAAIAGQPVSSLIASMAGQTTPARMSAGLALVVLAFAGFVAAARAAGPVALSAPDASWLLLSPLERRGVLGRTARLLVVTAVVAGALLGLGLLAALGAPDGLLWRLAGALVLGVSVTVGAMALAVLEQASRVWDGWLGIALTALVTLAVVLSTAAVAAQTARPALTGTGLTTGTGLLAGSGPASGSEWAAGTVAGAAGVLPAVLHGVLGAVGAVAAAPPAVVAVAAVSAALAAALLVRQAWAALERMPVRTVLAASTRTAHVTRTATLLDPGALTWIAEDNHWRARRLRSRRWPSLPAPAALAWHDWRRLARRPGRLAAMAASAALPAVLAQALGITATGADLPPGMPGPATIAPAAAVATPSLTAVAVTAGAVLAGALAVAAAVAAGARRDADNPALSRLAAVGLRPALAARAVLPALLTASWTAAALTGLSLVGALPGGAWWAFGPAIAPAVAAGSLRMARRRPIDHSMPIIDTPGGAIPTGPLFWALTGADVALVGCLPALVALLTPPDDLAGPLALQAVTGAAALAAYLLRARKPTAAG